MYIDEKTLTEEQLRRLAHILQGDDQDKKRRRLFVAASYAFIIIVILFILGAMLQLMFAMHRNVIMFLQSQC